MADLRTLTIGSDSMNVPSILDSIYPVGSYYWTSSSTFNPNTAWGGTWVLQQEGVFLQTAGANHPVSNNATDGGEDEVTLDVENLPDHDHWLVENGQTRTQGLFSDGSISQNGTKRAYPASSTSGVYFVYGQTAGASVFERRVTGFMYDADISALDQPHNNLPPYKNAYCWHRTA